MVATQPYGALVLAAQARLVGAVRLRRPSPCGPGSSPSPPSLLLAAPLWQTYPTLPPASTSAWASRAARSSGRRSRCWATSGGRSRTSRPGWELVAVPAALVALARPRRARAAAPEAALLRRPQSRSCPAAGAPPPPRRLGALTRDPPPDLRPSRSSPRPRGRAPRDRAARARAGLLLARARRRGPRRRADRVGVEQVALALRGRAGRARGRRARRPPPSSLRRRGPTTSSSATSRHTSTPGARARLSGRSSSPAPTRARARGAAGGSGPSDAASGCSMPRTSSTSRRERMTVPERSPGPGFEARAFGPFLSSARGQPVGSAEAFLHDTIRVERMAQEMEIGDAWVNLQHGGRQRSRLLAERRASASRSAASRSTTSRKHGACSKAASPAGVSALARPPAPLQAPGCGCSRKTSDDAADEEASAACPGRRARPSILGSGATRDLHARRPAPRRHRAPGRADRGRYGHLWAHARGSRRAGGERRGVGRRARRAAPASSGKRARDPAGRLARPPSSPPAASRSPGPVAGRGTGTVVSLATAGRTRGRC